MMQSILRDKKNPDQYSTKLNIKLSTVIVSQDNPYMAVRVSCKSGRKIAPNTGANATKFFTLATKSWKLVIGD